MVFLTSQGIKKAISLKRNQGQVLIIVLIAVMMGGLTIAPALYLTGTTLKSVRIHTQRAKEFYAADAGIKYAAWRVRYQLDPTAPAGMQLPGGATNGMYVWITISGSGSYSVTSEVREAAGSGGDFKTQIHTTITRTGGGPIPVPYNISVAAYDSPVLH